MRADPLSLPSKQAYGGRKELVALEEVRLDIADGQLDGVADRKKVRVHATPRRRGGVEASPKSPSLAPARRSAPRRAPQLHPDQ